jgi:hypothetical protein
VWWIVGLSRKLEENAMSQKHIAPDDLKSGQSYRFEYVSASGKKVIVFGVYEGTKIDHGIMWYKFDVEGSVYYFDHGSLDCLTEVE